VTAPDANRAPWPQERVERWPDADWWEREIDAVLAIPDAAEQNRAITVAHEELSLALARVIGGRSGANFHTWAVWGSHKAGRTIRGEDLPWLPAAAGVGGATAGAALAATAGTLAGAPRPVRAAASAAGGLIGGLGTRQAVMGAIRRASDLVLGGNITVLDDIGRTTARFVSRMWDPARRTPEAMDAFVAELRPGHPSQGGQDFLGQAFRSYFIAGTCTDTDECHERMLLANLLALLHEHWRLEPYIDGSMPRPMRRVITANLLSYAVGTESLDVAEDVPQRAEGYPETLRTIETEELAAFLTSWDRTPNTVEGSAAVDWTEIGERLNYIVDLFRTRHLDPNLFASPFTPVERDAILARR
jgi:hypothetical protein